MSDYANPEKQKARGHLRELFLRALNEFKGKDCIIYMQENTTRHARFISCDVELQEILVEKLETPVGLIDYAKLRYNDIFSIQFKDTLML